MSWPTMDLMIVGAVLVDLAIAGGRWRPLRWLREASGLHVIL